MMKNSERYTLVQIVVKLQTDGRGMNRTEIDKMCDKLKKTAKGRSKNREVFVFC
jgi:hypothetical protein